MIAVDTASIGVAVMMAVGVRAVSGARDVVAGPVVAEADVVAIVEITVVVVQVGIRVGGVIAHVGISDVDGRIVVGIGVPSPKRISEAHREGKEGMTKVSEAAGEKERMTKGVEAVEAVNDNHAAVDTKAS
jgi:hypothetical protein